MKLNQKSGLLVMAVLTASCSPSTEKKQEADSLGQSNIPMERSSAGKKRAALQNGSVTPIYLENSADQRIQTVLYAQGALESRSENQHADLAAALLIRMIRPSSLFNQNPLRVLALEISPQEVVKSLSEFFVPSTSQGISALDISTALQDFASKVQTSEESEAEKNLRIKFASWSTEIVRKAHTRAAEGDAQIQATLRGYFPSVPVQAKNEELLRKLKPTVLTQALIKMEGTSVKDLKKAQEIAKAAWDDIQNAKKNIRVILGKDELRHLNDEGKKNRLERELRQVEAGVELVTTVIEKVFKKPEDAKKFKKTMGDVIQVTRALSNLKLGELSAQLMTGNFVGAGLSLVGSLMGGTAGAADPMADIRHTEVLSAIADVRADIAEFRQEMEFRMNRMDSKLDQILSTLDQQMNLAVQARKSLGEIQMQIKGLSYQLMDVQAVVHRGFNDLYEKDYRLNYETCVVSPLADISLRASISNDKNFMDNCIVKFYTRAVDDSLRGTRNYSAGDLESYVGLSTALRSSTNEQRMSVMLFQSAYKQVFGKNLELSNTPLAPNVDDWIMGVRSMLTFREMFPVRTEGVSLERDRVMKAIQQGENLEEAMLGLSSVSTLQNLTNEIGKLTELFFSGHLSRSDSQASRLELAQDLLLRIIETIRPDLFDDPSMRQLLTPGLGIASVSEAASVGEQGWFGPGTEFSTQVMSRHQWAIVLLKSKWNKQLPPAQLGQVTEWLEKLRAYSKAAEL